MSRTKIEWAANPDGTPGMVWDFAAGCQKTSPGCDNCWALKSVWRLQHNKGTHYYRKGLARKLESQLVWSGFHAWFPELRRLPTITRKATTFFVCSKCDIALHDPLLDCVTEEAVLNPRHRFLLLSKRPSNVYTNRELPPNVGVGVSVENQDYLWRVDKLLKIPAAMRFVSLEPLLGAVDLGLTYLKPFDFSGSAGKWPKGEMEYRKPVDWVIVGCESGKNRRECKIEWIEQIVQQCVEAEVPVFVKQADIDGKPVKMPKILGKVWDQRPEWFGGK